MPRTRPSAVAASLHLLAVLCLSSVLLVDPAQGTVITVGWSGDRRSLRLAAEAAAPYDTLLLIDSTIEDGVLIDKPLTLRAGPGLGPGTVGLCGYSGPSLTVVNTRDVVIEGLYICLATMMPSAGKPTSAGGRAFLVVSSAAVTMLNCHTLVDNATDTVVRCQGGATVTLRGNRFGEWGIVLNLLGAGNVVDARWNWWETTDPLAIDKMILDESPVAGKARVVYTPWLTSADQAARATAVQALPWAAVKRPLAAPWESR